MQNHYFDDTKACKPYTCSAPANPASLPPENAVRRAPPEIIEGYWPCWNGASWEHVPDLRGTAYYVCGPDMEVQTVTISEIGVTIPENGYLDIEDIPLLPRTLAEAKAVKTGQINLETSEAIFAGFDYEIDGQILHFSYDSDDQQNFADTANAATLAMIGVPGIPAEIVWNGWAIEKDEKGIETSRTLVRLALDPQSFLDLYMNGALLHKATCMEAGSQRKATVDAAITIEEACDA